MNNQCIWTECAKQNELYCFQTSSSSFKCILESSASYSDFGDPTSIHQVPWQSWQVSVCNPGHQEEWLLYSFIFLFMYFSIQCKIIIYSNPFKTILMSWFTQQIWTEQQLYVKNLCQNFSVHKSRQFLLQRSIVWWRAQWNTILP